MIYMNKDIAIAFLKAHQPMPNDDILDEELINKYDEVREFFLSEPSEECIPLFLNSFGEYDGLGVYQLVEDVILKFKHEIVVEYLKESLRSEHKGARYWSAQIAMSFPDNILVAPLSDLLMDEVSDIRIAAISALAEIPDLDINKILTSHLDRENDDYVKEFITDIINDREV